MEIYERIRYLRKSVLKMSQEKFGDILGVNRSNINNIEGNRLAKPEQKEPLYRLICKTFDVNYEWLTTGHGDIFDNSTKAFVERLVKEMKLNPTIRGIIESYLRMGEEQRAFVDAFFKTIDVMYKNSPDKSVNVDDALDQTTTTYKPSKPKMDRETAKEIINNDMLGIQKEKNTDDELMSYTDINGVRRPMDINGRHYTVKEFREESERMESGYLILEDGKDFDDEFISMEDYNKRYSQSSNKNKRKS